MWLFEAVSPCQPTSRGLSALLAQHDMLWPLNWAAFYLTLLCVLRVQACVTSSTYSNRNGTTEQVWTDQPC
jgi:hypothetical protein